MKYLLMILIFGTCSISLYSQAVFSITHHIVRMDDGSGGQNIEMIPEIMQELNKAFAPARIQFKMSCVGINIINNSGWYNFDKRIHGPFLESDIVNAHYVSNTINIFYFNSIIGAVDKDGKPIYYAGDADTPRASPHYYTGYRGHFRVKSIGYWACNDISHPNRIKESGLHIHEMGHYMGIREHTFENYNNANLAEHPDRDGPNKNCDWAGDGFCDTPADIEFSGLRYGYYKLDWIDSCSYCVQLKDSFFFPDNGWWYKPDIKNYMSYSYRLCREHFSQQQCAKMEYNTWSLAGLSSKKILGFVSVFDLTSSRIPVSFNPVINDSLMFFYDDCDPIPKPQDTIFYRNKDGVDKCLSQDTTFYGTFYGIRFSGSISNTSILDSAVWYINGDSVQKGTSRDSWMRYLFPLSDFDSLWKNPNYTDDYIIITVVIPINDSISIEYNFKFKVSDNAFVAEAITSYWKDAGVDFDTVDNYITVSMDLSDGFTIPLPALNCDVNVEADSIFSWKVENNSIIFEPTEECNIDIFLQYNCECIGKFAFNIYNLDCIKPCDSVVISNRKHLPPSSTDTLLKLPFGFTPPPKLPHKLPWAHILNPYPVHYNLYAITASYKIGNIEVNILSDASDVESDITIDNETGNINFRFICSGSQDAWGHLPGSPWFPDSLYSYYEIPVEICITLDTEEEDRCCDTITINLRCIGLLKNGGAAEGGIIGGGLIGIHYELYDLPDFYTPLNIAIYDHNFDKVLDIMSAEATKLSDTFYLVAGSLSAGSYYIVYQLHNQIVAVPFTVEGVIKYVEAVPNPDSQGNLTINYAFNSMPQGAIKISVVDMLGIERAVVYNGVVGSLKGSFPANINHLPAGFYQIKLEAITENETATFSFIKQ